MCFGGQTVTAPSNPAPYSLDNSQSAVNSSVGPAPQGTNPAQALAAQDQQVAANPDTSSAGGFPSVGNM